MAPAEAQTHQGSFKAEVDLKIIEQRVLPPSKRTAEAFFRKKESRTRVGCRFSSEGWYLRWEGATNTRFEYLCDGVNTLHRWIIVKDMPPSPQITKRYGSIVSTRPWTPRDPIPLIIVPGVYIINADIRVNAVWLALCSPARLMPSPLRLPLPSRVIQLTSDAFGFEVRAERFDDRLGLPKQVAFFTSKSQLRSSVWQRYRLRDLNDRSRITEATAARRTSEADGKLVSEYHVLTSTNLDGAEIPLTFSLTEYFSSGWLRSAGYREPAEQVRRVEVAGKISSLVRTKEPLPTMITNGASFSVNDRRFRHPEKVVDHINYTIKDGGLPGTNDPVLKKLFLEAVAKAPPDPLRPAGKRFRRLYLTLITGSLGIIGIYVFLVRKSKPKEPRTKGRS